jgi:hypothetical protein
MLFAKIANCSYASLYLKMYEVTCIGIEYRYRSGARFLFLENTSDSFMSGYTLLAPTLCDECRSSSSHLFCNERHESESLYMYYFRWMQATRNPVDRELKRFLE